MTKRLQAALLLVLASPGYGGEPAGALVKVSGVVVGRGDVWVRAFDSRREFPLGNFRSAGFAPGQAAAVEVALPGLPSGRYALAAFQDFNGNGELDTNFMGVPQEPYGFSNYTVGGPLSFEASGVVLNGSTEQITIQLLWKSVGLGH